MTLASTVTPDLELDDTVVETSRTYQLANDKVQGCIDGIEAVKQFISKVLGTEQYDYEIYSLDYGMQTSDLIGKDREYVQSELQRRIADILTEDSRINSVDNFVFSATGDALTVTFDVATIYGTTTQEVTVNV